MRFAVRAFLLHSVASVALCAARPARAQSAEPAACTYARCAVTIAPRWNGLAVVRPSGATVANLNFFWPHDVTPAFAGASSDTATTLAASEARRAVTLRRAAAALTDAGLALGAVFVVRSADAGRIQQGDGAVAVAGALALGASIPLQFAADGALSRAVWWFNARFARPSH